MNLWLRKTRKLGRFPLKLTFSVRGSLTEKLSTFPCFLNWVWFFLWFVWVGLSPFCDSLHLKCCWNWMVCVCVYVCVCFWCWVLQSYSILHWWLRLLENMFEFPLCKGHNDWFLLRVALFISELYNFFFKGFCFCSLWFEIHGFGSINLKSMQAENLSNVVPATSRSSNYIALRYCDFPSENAVRWSRNNRMLLLGSSSYYVYIN